MLETDNFIKRILDCVDEAQKNNYPYCCLKMDLTNLIKQHDEELIEAYSLEGDD